jgi:outer membrane protein, adhesin transport system
VRQMETRLRRLVGDALPSSEPLPAGLLQVPELNQAIQSVEQAPDIAQLSKQAQASATYARVVSAGQGAQVNLAVNGSQVRGVGNSGNWFAGINVSMPLFNAGYKHSSAAALKRAEAAAMQRDETLDAKRFRVAEVHEQASTSFERARRVVEVVRNSELVRGYTLQQWQQLGRRSLFDVMGSESEHYALRVSYVNALYDAQQGTAMLWSLGPGILAYLK